MAGAEQEWRPQLGGEVPRRGADLQTSLPGLYAVGDGAGIGGYKMAMIEGALAGIWAAARLDHHLPEAEVELRELQRSRQREAAFQQLYSHLFSPGPGIDELAQDDTLICRCEGVTLGRLRQAVQPGVEHISELKNLTRCGMGECQGRVCGPAVTQTLARLAGISPAQVGWNAPRPPLFPLPVSHLHLEE
jgi:bacterioferritin-associated ferredoxin